MSQVNAPIESDVLHQNPCEACTIDQDCCTRLSGLRLTQIEFERCFRHHADDIITEREGPLYVVSQKHGGKCPNWQEGGCSVYDERPRECALFPFTLYTKKQGGGFSVRVHSDTNCPLKSELLSSQAEAESLAREFAEEAFGAMNEINVAHETSPQWAYRKTREWISSVLSLIKNR